HVGLMVLQTSGTIDAFINTVFNYPSLGDTYKYAAYDGLGALARRAAKTYSKAPLSDRELQVAYERRALRVQPLLRRGVAVAQRRAAGLEAHGRAEEEAVGPRRLEQIERRARKLHRERREAECEQVLAIDPACLLHDRVHAARPHRAVAAVDVRDERVHHEHDVGARLRGEIGVAAEAGAAIDVVAAVDRIRIEEPGNGR